MFIETCSANVENEFLIHWIAIRIGAQVIAKRRDVEIVFVRIGVGAQQRTADAGRHDPVA
jgi:hypothetical protein